jgi:beta-N-acetylhexosaminidase
VDSLPAGFSNYWLQEVLRQQLGFQGAIFSDDLSMHGASVIGDFEQRARQTLSAGADMALVCNNRSAAERVIDRLNGIEINAESTKRLEAMRPASWVITDKLEYAEQWKRSHKVIEALS